VKWSDIELILYSLGFSIILYISLGYIYNVRDFNSIKDMILIPDKTLMLLGFMIILGIGPGLLLRYWLKRKNIYLGDAWSNALSEESNKEEELWLLIYTNNGCEYKGMLGFYDVEEDPKSLTITQPYMIIRDKNFNVKEEFEIGNEIIFKEKDILRVIILKNINETIKND